MTDRKKSWREIDQGREKGRTRSTDPSERARERASRSAAYGQYKSQLDKLFTPGGADLPEALRERLGPADPDAQARRERLKQLTQDPGAETLRPVVESQDPLPADPRLLMGLMDVSDPQLLLPVLARLAELIDQGARFSAPLLRQRLQAVQQQEDEPSVLEQIQRIRDLARL